jgi:hypothetical protein
MEISDKNSSTHAIESILSVHKILGVSENYFADIDPDASMTIAKAREDVFSAVKTFINTDKKHRATTREMLEHFDSAIHHIRTLPQNGETGVMYGIVEVLNNLKREMRDN